MLFTESIKKDATEYHWLSAINSYLLSGHEANIPEKLSSIRLRQAIWLGLIDLSSFDCAIVIEFGIGAHAISLSEKIASVYSIETDLNKQQLSSHRYEYLGINNIEVVNSQKLETTEIIGERILLIGSNDGSIDGFDLVVNRLINNFNISETAFFYSSCRRFPLLRIKNNQTYHVTGKFSQPFQFVPAKSKKQNLGGVKYFIYRLRECVQHLPMIESSIPFTESMFSKIISHVTNLLSLSESLKYENGYFIKPLGVLLRVSSKDKNWMIRVALSDKAKDKFRQGKELLRSFENFIPQIPIIYKDGNYKGYYFLIESCFPGKNLNHNFLKNIYFQENIYAQALELLIKIQVGSEERTKCTELFFDQHIGLLIENLRVCFSAGFADFIDKLENYLKQASIGKQYLTVTSHGDYSVDNIIIEKSTITGLIDWEFSKKNGTALVDLLFFIVSVNKYTCQNSLTDAMIEVLLLNKLSEFEHRLIDKYCENFLIEKELIEFYRVMMIVEFLCFRLDIDDEIDVNIIYDRSYSAILYALDENILSKNL